MSDQTQITGVREQDRGGVGGGDGFSSWSHAWQLNNENEWPNDSQCEKAENANKEEYDTNEPGAPGEWASSVPHVVPFWIQWHFSHELHLCTYVSY